MFVKVHVKFIDFKQDSPILERFCTTYVNYFMHANYYAGIFFLNI